MLVMSLLLAFTISNTSVFAQKTKTTFINPSEVSFISGSIIPVLIIRENFQFDFDISQFGYFISVIVDIEGTLHKGWFHLEPKIIDEVNSYLSDDQKEKSIISYKFTQNLKKLISNKKLLLRDLKLSENKITDPNLKKAQDDIVEIYGDSKKILSLID